MAQEVDKNSSIIQIIQKMVQNNEPEEKIISTLVELGVSEEQAKRLLLIAESDTFTLLKSEIEKMAKNAIVDEQKKVIDESTKVIEETISKKRAELQDSIDKSFLKQTAQLQEKQELFQKDIASSVAKLAQLNQEVFESSEANKKTIDIIKKDLDETKLKGIKARQSYLRYVITGFAILVSLLAIVFVLSVDLNNFNIDNLTGAVVFSLIGTSLIYLSVNL